MAWEKVRNVAANREEAIETIEKYKAGKIKVEGSGYDRINAAFTFFWDMVKPAGYWKDPIDAKIKPDDFAFCKAAVGFFTGTELEIVASIAGRDHVKAAGYQAGPCGDH